MFMFVAVYCCVITPKLYLSTLEAKAFKAVSEEALTSLTLTPAAVTPRRDALNGGRGGS